MIPDNSQARERARAYAADADDVKLLVFAQCERGDKRNGQRAVEADIAGYVEEIIFAFEQATKARLEELIARWLPSVSQPGDTVFIYFSGHAGHVLLP